MVGTKKIIICLFAILLLLFVTSNTVSVDDSGCSDSPTIIENPIDYFLRWALLPATFDPDSFATVAVEGNLPPFSWSVSGSGFELELAEGAVNTLEAYEDACGTAEITVSDSAGNTLIGYVRCSNGGWGESIDGCIVSGENADSCFSAGGGSGWGGGTFIVIQGKYKQTQVISGSSHFEWEECPSERCSNYCATASQCDPGLGCEPCLFKDKNEIPCINAGYAGSSCPNACRAWCSCNKQLYYQEWQCSGE
jgi:hypothetical protein